jgi:signal peptidase I
MNKSSDNHIIVKSIGFSFLDEGTTLKIKADGYSMYPSIKPGSVILIEPLADGLFPSPGEIIAWKRESGLVVHRLVRITKDENKISYITRGDSCAYEDKPIIRDQIAGKVIRVETPSGMILSSEDNLIRKPSYLYNRLMVWVLVRIKKLFNDPPFPLNGG